MDFNFAHFLSQILDIILHRILSTCTTQRLYFALLRAFRANKIVLCLALSYKASKSD